MVENIRVKIMTSLGTTLGANIAIPFEQVLGRGLDLARRDPLTLEDGLDHPLVLGLELALALDALAVDAPP